MGPAAIGRLGQHSGWPYRRLGAGPLPLGSLGSLCTTPDRARQVGAESDARRTDEAML